MVTEEKLKEFFSYANSFHETIKFTCKWSTEELPFLDVMVRRSGVGLVTNVYSKPTDAHQYLDHRSCHPNHVKKGIPYGQALRLRRICDSDEVFDKSLKDLKGAIWIDCSLADTSVSLTSTS